MKFFTQGKIDNQKAYDGLPFPKVFVAEKLCNSPEYLVKLVLKDKDFFIEELHKHGALLFRGFPIHEVEDFDKFVKAFEWQALPHTGRAPRSHVVGNVWTANEGDLSEELFFHHEMSARKHFPSKVFFYCEVPPPVGGETAILQSKKVTDYMESAFPEFVKELEENGLLQIHLLLKSNGAQNVLSCSWQCFFGTDDTREAEKKAKLDGWMLKWGEDGVEMISGKVEGIRIFEGYEGRKMWFNHIPLAMSKETSSITKLKMGDGSEIPKNVVEECGRFMDEECVDIAWEKGDVLLLDNLAVMHPRRPSIPPRRILASICK